MSKLLVKDAPVFCYTKQTEASLAKLCAGIDKASGNKTTRRFIQSYCYFSKGNKGVKCTANRTFGLLVQCSG